jgi:hypothetical protein
MSDDPQGKPLQTDAPETDRVLTESAYAELRKLNEYILNGVRFVKRSNRGPITIHSTASQEVNQIQPFDSRIPDEEAQAIIDKYMENLKADAEKE